MPAGSWDWIRSDSKCATSLASQAGVNTSSVFRLRLMAFSTLTNSGAPMSKSRVSRHTCRLACSGATATNHEPMPCQPGCRRCRHRKNGPRVGRGRSGISRRLPFNRDRRPLRTPTQHFTIHLPTTSLVKQAGDSSHLRYSMPYCQVKLHTLEMVNGCTPAQLRRLAGTLASSLTSHPRTLRCKSLADGDKRGPVPS